MFTNHLLLICVGFTMAVPALAQEERRVPNLFLQFSNLNAKADPLGSNLGVAADIPSVLQCMHYQGIVRLENAGTPYFIITRSGNNTDTCPANPDNPGELVVVQMGSRGTDGERLRSNRLGLNSRFNDTAPDAADTAVVSIPLDGFARDGYGNTWPGWSHPGGC